MGSLFWLLFDFISLNVKKVKIKKYLKTKSKLRGRSQIDFMTNSNHVFRNGIVLLEMLVPKLKM